MPKVNEDLGSQQISGIKILPIYNYVRWAKLKIVNAIEKVCKKMQSVYMKIIFVPLFFLLAWLILVPECFTIEIPTLQEKAKTVQQMVRQMRNSGKSLPSEVTGELQKARKARKEKDWLVLEKSLDRILKICSKNSDGELWALTPQEREILAGADERIEKYRMATANLSVVTGDGKPLSDAKVKIEQMDHEFLFGINQSYSMWFAIFTKKFGRQSLGPDIYRRLKRFKVSESKIEECLNRFTEFANYTSLPVAWPVYERKKGQITHRLYDNAITWLHDKGFKVIAHNLVWNNNTPKWVPRDCNGIVKAVEKRVRDFVSYYKGRFDYFIIFNEAAQPFRSIFAKDKMTTCFREIGHVPFVSIPFEICREVNPTAKLMINETSILEHHGFPELLRNLEDSKENPLYDIIGIQSHMHRRTWPLDGVWKICELYSTFNVPLHFTELTVLSGTPIRGKGYGMETTPEGERQQAEYVVNLYTTLFSHPSVEAIQWWNLTDCGAWKGAPAGLLRKDMSPKPAYDALMHLIKTKWWTKVQTRTSKQGLSKFKGFFGEYRIVVTSKEGQSRSFNIKLINKGKRSFRLVL